MKRSRESQEMEPGRLFEASMAILKALAEVSETTGGRRPYPPDLVGSPMQPRCLRDFTRGEVLEATAFLIRMGYIEVPRSAG